MDAVFFCGQRDVRLETWLSAFQMPGSVFFIKVSSRFEIEQQS